jgi:catechol 2,3-dioxygenase-like lactoylglutathione lyase family enzyme
MRLGLTALLVHDYDEAIAFFCGAMGFSLAEDIEQGDGKRWVVVRGEDGGGLLLARAVNDRQRAAIGDQFGGRVGLFAYTNDFESTRSRLMTAGATFEEQPRNESYGTVAVFRDLYGNRWDLIEGRPQQ